MWAGMVLHINCQRCSRHFGMGLTEPLSEMKKVFKAGAKQKKWFRDLLP